MKALAWIAAVCMAASAWGQELERAAAGEFKVTQKDADWRDEARKRDVPVRVYVPGNERKQEAGFSAPLKCPHIQTPRLAQSFCGFRGLLAHQTCRPG